jgi:hypothetical protein
VARVDGIAERVEREPGRRQDPVDAVEPNPRPAGAPQIGDRLPLPLHELGDVEGLPPIVHGPIDHLEVVARRALEVVGDERRRIPQIGEPDDLPAARIELSTGRELVELAGPAHFHYGQVSPRSVWNKT